MAATAKLRKLNPLQERFVEEYLVDFNGTQAAIRAGYKGKYQEKIARDLLRKTTVIQALADARADRAKRTHITADWVLSSLQTVAVRCMQAEPVMDKEGNETGEYRFDSAGANRALELLGRHLGMWGKGDKGSGAQNVQINYYFPRPVPLQDAMIKYGTVELQQGQDNQWMPIASLPQPQG